MNSTRSHASTFFLLLLVGTQVANAIIVPDVGFAQGPPPPQAGGAGNAPGGSTPGTPPTGAAVPAPSFSSTLKYPTSLDPFVRGNAVPSRGDHPNLQVNAPPQAGRYLADWKVVFLIGLFAFWLHYSNWVHEDSRGLKVRPEFWNSLMLGGGVLALLLMLCFPTFFFGVGGFALAMGCPLGIYVWERNQVVPEARRVMTPAHLENWARRQLAKLGIRFNRTDRVDPTTGPPIEFLGKSRTGQKDASRSKQVESSKGYVGAKELVYDALMRRATDIHLEPKETELAVRLRIDGVMFPAEPFDRATGEAITNIIKVLCAMDITERRRSQDGSFAAVVDGREIDFRVASQGTRHGEKVSMRILDQSNSVSKMVDLGMRKAVQDKLIEVINQPHGLLLVCGPTGAGKSTTLYTAINELDAYEKNIITVEDPVEYKMPNVTQIEINTKGGTTFAQSLRSILRQDPDVVMIGEIRDEETAKIACQAANTGHMVFSTVHANDSLTALYRLLDLKVEPFMLSTAISAILAQRLARRLCPNCKESYAPTPDLLKSLGLPVGKVKEFFRPPTGKENTCTKCSGTGYYGRVGVYELLTLNDRIKDLVRDNSTMSSVRNEARKNGMLYMSEEGLRLVVKGVTSLDEIRRVAM
ncbi:GspE/PulE family protein [Planctomicrobium sp. SH668]|uniref:GspE/PulE family protein n=1 Tax=Planctomicrobium sp. SH668 TaxID=3448126 RepID=UPI003F5B1422